MSIVFGTFLVEVFIRVGIKFCCPPPEEEEEEVNASASALKSEKDSLKGK